MPEEKEWLSEKLGHEDEKTLAQRLGEILELHKQQVTKFIDQQKEFSDSIRHTPTILPITKLVRSAWLKSLKA